MKMNQVYMPAVFASLLLAVSVQTLAVPTKPFSRGIAETWAAEEETSLDGLIENTGRLQEENKAAGSQVRAFGPRGSPVSKGRRTTKKITMVAYSFGSGFLIKPRSIS